MTRRVVAILVLGAVSLVAGACSRESGEGAVGHGSERQAQRDETPSSPKEGFVEVVKEIKLPGYTTSNIGDAFNNYRYFGSRKWRETRFPDGKIYIDFWGWFNTSKFDVALINNGITARGVEIKFVIYPDGAFRVAMISKIESRVDGKISAYPLEDKKSIMDAIYANKEITF